MLMKSTKSSPTVTRRPSPQFGKKTTVSKYSDNGNNNNNLQYSDAVQVLPSSDNIYILAFFPIHQKIDKQCKPALRQDVFQSLHSMLWSLQTLQHEKLSGLNVGAIIIDTCHILPKLDRFFLDLMENRVLFTPGNFTLDSTRIFAALNSPDTEEAILISEKLERYSIPSVSPGFPAKLGQLSESMSVNFTLRSSTSLDDQVGATMQIFQRLNWNTVFLVHSENFYGLASKLAFEQESENSQICLARTFSLKTHKTECKEQSKKIFDYILKFKASGIRGIMVWLHQPGLHCFLSVYKQLVVNQQTNLQIGDLIFIVPPDISDIENFFEDFVPETAGMLILRYDTVEPILKFQTYFRNIDLQSGDFWTPDYWQKTLKCTENNNRRLFSEKCQSEHEKFAMEKYTTNSHLLTTVNAVYSILLGTGQFLRSFCPDGKILCAKFEHYLRNLDDIMGMRGKILEKIKSMRFMDVTGEIFSFSTGTNSEFGNKPMHLMNLVKNGDIFEFSKVFFIPVYFLVHFFLNLIQNSHFN